MIPIGSNSKQHVIFHYVTEFNRKVIEEKEMSFSPALVYHTRFEGNYAN